MTTRPGCFTPYCSSSVSHILVEDIDPVAGKVRLRGSRFRETSKRAGKRSHRDRVIWLEEDQIATLVAPRKDVMDHAAKSVDTSPISSSNP